MNSSQLLRKARDAIYLEFKSLLTQGCGLPYVIRKWNSIIRDNGEITFLGKTIYFEDRLNPMTMFCYIDEARKCGGYITTKNPRILDIGANIGIWARAIFNRYDSAMIYSFEPNGAPYKYLVKNSKEFSNWKVFNFGIGSKDGPLDFYYVPRKSGQGSVYEENASYNLMSNVPPQKIIVDILVLSANFLRDECGGTHFDFIKIDVEGAEYEVLEGLKYTTWGAMYVELSVNRAGKVGLDNFSQKIKEYWPSARCAYSEVNGNLADVFYTCKAKEVS